MDIEELSNIFEAIQIHNSNIQNRSLDAKALGKEIDGLKNLRIACEIKIQEKKNLLNNRRSTREEKELINADLSHYSTYLEDINNIIQEFTLPEDKHSARPEVLASARPAVASSARPEVLASARSAVLASARPAVLASAKQPSVSTSAKSALAKPTVGSASAVARLAKQPSVSTLAKSASAKSTVVSARPSAKLASAKLASAKLAESALRRQPAGPSTVTASARQPAGPSTVIASASQQVEEQVVILLFNPQREGSICRLVSILLGSLFLIGTLRLNITQQHFIGILNHHVITSRIEGITGNTGLDDTEIDQRLYTDVKKVDVDFSDILVEHVFINIRNIRNNIATLVNKYIDRNCVLSITFLGTSFSITIFNRNIIFIDSHGAGTYKDGAKGHCIIAQSLDALLSNRTFNILIEEYINFARLADNDPSNQATFPLCIVEINRYEYIPNPMHHNKYMKYKNKYINLSKNN
jgi:hypothetical protein